MSYRIEYADAARTALNAMPTARRTAFETGMRKIAADPYGKGTGPAVSPREPDRRSAPVDQYVVVYYVSRPVLLITTVHIIG
ncbi:hypothetical protein [Streptomyces albipurpureus]|uniref:Type II toxin-antitoxin system RelE/ParE family toxin n=1 Tax=Streptomyces albipurpureus TaxID=2897419 RepID=A0ABT0V466_9ACTN|nr:hypothetical protein [Streptomyces sp. CWNU-1]MCM2394343.1 hypothetical protein [Streptomyces sp. CWNU-1]